ncbi:MAG: PD40 domain-containing protein [Solirubrobacteraceae bacterium]|nr:PD40 domain-containing protein [Solirubrobacteraceae bacterium]
MPLRRLTALTIAAAALAPAAAAHAAPGDTTLVSRASGAAGALADSTVFNPEISADGSTVMFSTQAENLGGFDADDTIDVYSRSLAANLTSLVSAGDNPMPALPDLGGDENSSSPSVSADGRFVAFVSDSTNLSPDDEDGAGDIFVRDRLTNTTELISRDDGIAGDAADDDSRRPSISADGRFVAFESDATNLSNADEDATSDIFVRDRQLHQTALVSHVELDGGDDDSTHPTISPDGNTIAFYSQATNLSDQDLNDVTDVFAHNRVTYDIELVSRDSAGTPANAGPNSSAALALSHDGDRIAFISAASNLAPGDGPSVDVFLRDRAATTTTLVSPGNAASFQPAMSADGTKVAFHSYATNLSPDDTDGAGDVYVHDLATGVISLESRTSSGIKADGASGSVSMTADGRAIAFSSSAANLGATGPAQAFVREIPAPATPAGGDGSGQGGTPQNAGAPAALPGQPSTSAPAKPRVRRTGKLRLGKQASTCLRRERLVLPLKLVGATPGVRITSTRVQVLGKNRIARFLNRKTARRPVVRKLGGRKVRVHIMARTNLGRTVTLTKTFRACRTR